jgi:predicted Fe-Mo cluster-binding NifX family protein
MKVAISALGNDLNAQIDSRFGRCQYFLIVDTDTMEFKAISNANIAASGGAGIGTAQAIAKEGAQVVITGNVGPNAFQTLGAAGIKMITGVSGTVRDAVEKFKRGELGSVSSPTVEGHHGMGGAGRGAGGGMGQ